ncbi:MAG: DUF3256 family protein, partial [Muribaculaceae bacterium]|nr:DUF3256 family protein [Muribaculaceae bacterium]
MKPRLCILAAILAVAPCLHAQGTAAPLSATMTARDAGSAQWFFAMAPDEVMPLLPANTRLDMLDYYNSGMQRPSRNEAGGMALITSSADRRLTFEAGDSCSYELAVFTTPRDTLVALIETLRYPMPDSRVEWFDARWQPVKAPVAEPGLKQWLTRDGARNRAEVEETIPFITATATADPDRRTITYT